MTGLRILQASVWGAVVFTGAAVLGVVAPDSFAAPAAAVHGVLFVVGFVAFVLAYGAALGRSRIDELSVAGVWFLAGGSAPARVRRVLLGVLALEVVGSLVAASIRPFTPVAFAILAPLHGLGLTGLWGARHGTFGPRRRST